MSNRVILNGVRAMPAVLACAAMLTGCQQTVPSKPEATIFQEDRPSMNLEQLPTLKQARAQMLDLIDAVRREISRQVPATVPWRWHYEFMTSSCEAEGLKLYFPKLGSDHALTDPEWAEVLPAVTRLAADAGLTGGGGGFQNTSGNHDLRLYSTDGRALSFGTRYATVISATVGCRLAPDDDLWVDGRIPTPPDPQP